MSLVSGPGRGGGESSTSKLSLAVERHIQYIVSLDKRSSEYEYHLTEHLRLNGVYWGLTALHILNKPEALPKDEVITFTMSCWDAESGGFGAAPGHDPHMLYTCSAVQILAMADGLKVLDEPIDEKTTETKKMKLGKCKCIDQMLLKLTILVIAGLQAPTGVFHGDQYGEPDTRFLYAALNALSLLNSMSLVDLPLAVKYIDSCANLDSGFGTVPGAESHAGQIFVCIAALALTGELEKRKKTNPEWIDRLAAWLSERQVSTTGPGFGGLNGRPEKKEDVCYSWWSLSPMAMLGKMDWIDRKALRRFILGCQDEKEGGFADRPGDAVDVYHTCFALAGLSLIEADERRTGDNDSDGFGLAEIDPM
jgi:geranylgeranyl transferase type-2 subunit beta